MSEETLESIVNELLPGAGAIGAYAMGMASVAALKTGLRPDRALFEQVRTAVSVGHADRMINEWIESVRVKARARTLERRDSPMSFRCGDCKTEWSMTITVPMNAEAYCALLRGIRCIECNSTLVMPRGNAKESGSGLPEEPQPKEPHSGG